MIMPLQSTTSRLIVARAVDILKWTRPARHTSAECA
jgi:hypothetical protein